MRESIGTTMTVPPPAASLASYVEAVRHMPVLNAAEERGLAQRYRRHNDLDAAWRLVVANLRHVIPIARGYRGYGLPEEDLIQEGNLGLMKAVRRYDPARGVRLMHYAVYWIRAAIHDYILRNWRMVKIATTKARRRLFYKLRHAKRHLRWLRRDEAEAIADELDVPVDEVVDMEGRLYRPDEPWEPAEVHDEGGLAPADYLADESSEPASTLAEAESRERARAAIGEALETLDDRSREIVMSRWFAEDRVTLQELGDQFGISAERVRQLERRAIERLRCRVLEQLGEEAAVATGTRGRRRGKLPGCE